MDHHRDGDGLLCGGVRSQRYYLYGLLGGGMGVAGWNPPVAAAVAITDFGDSCRMLDIHGCTASRFTGLLTDKWELVFEKPEMRCLIEAWSRCAVLAGGLV